MRCKLKWTRLVIIQIASNCTLAAQLAALEGQLDRSVHPPAGSSNEIWLPDFFFLACFCTVFGRLTPTNQGSEVDQIYHLACPASPVHYQSVLPGIKLDRGTVNTI